MAYDREENEDNEEIKNWPELVNAICSIMEREINDFCLQETDVEACVNVQAEIDCMNTYERGRKSAEVLKTHVSNAVSYFKQISDALEAADQEVARRTRDGCHETSLSGNKGGE